jgi:hypothetical protein
MSRRVGAVIVVPIVIVAVSILVLLRSIAYVPILNDGGADIHSAADLPEHIHVCGRTYGHHQGTGTERSLAEVMSMLDQPAFVNPWWFAACPRGGQLEYNGNHVNTTVMFVRVGEDAYLTYELAGGP